MNCNLPAHLSFFLISEIPGTSKSFVTNGTRMDGPPRRLQEERAIDRKAPIDLELPYHEILRWNPKWLEVNRDRSLQQQTKGQPKANVKHSFWQSKAGHGIFFGDGCWTKSLLLL